MEYTTMKLRDLLPVEYVYWCWDITWDAYPFRVLYLGFWLVVIDRSGRWFERWPHISISWNDAVGN